MKPFLNNDFLLQNDTAAYLYHTHAAHLPIIDYHNHLPSDEIAQDKKFSSITEVWLKGDHYKWRAMRANGIDEKYISGDASDRDKFRMWAKTVPYTMRNPLYHWTHLELQRYFGIYDLLSEQNADEIFDKTTAMLQQDGFGARGLLEKMNVNLVGTTDEVTDDLAHHKAYAAQGHSMIVAPTYRPDKFIHLEQGHYIDLVAKLSAMTTINIDSFESLMSAMKKRADYFDSVGCIISDHGLSNIPAAQFDTNLLNAIVKKRLAGAQLTHEEIRSYKAGIMYHLGLMYHKLGWVMQLHVGAIRNNNTRLMNEIGADVGCDSIGDYSHSEGLSQLLNSLDTHGQLTKTILYNLNPSDNEVFASMAGNFNDGSIAGKVQWGSAWWFLDQKDGMEKQLNALSNMGLLSQFIGMLTDSRSFLSFPRHEYFRRILCTLLGEDVQNGLLPNDRVWLGEMVENICFYNAKNYFNLQNKI